MSHRTRFALVPILLATFACAADVDGPPGSAAPKNFDEVLEPLPPYLTRVEPAGESDFVCAGVAIAPRTVLVDFACAWLIHDFNDPSAGKPTVVLPSTGEVHAVEDFDTPFENELSVITLSSPLDLEMYASLPAQAEPRLEDGDVAVDLVTFREHHPNHVARQALIARPEGASYYAVSNVFEEQSWNWNWVNGFLFSPRIEGKLLGVSSHTSKFEDRRRFTNLETWRCRVARLVERKGNGFGPTMPWGVVPNAEVFCR